MDKKTTKILLIDDDEDVLQAARLLLKQHVLEVTTETRPAKIPEILKKKSYDVILLDMNFTRDVSSGKEGFHWLDEILKIDPSAVVILITAYGDVEMAVTAIKAGAADFVLKPWQNEKLLATISAGVRLHSSQHEVESLKSREKQLSADINQKYDTFIGESDVMKDVFATIDKVAGTDANLLILGENGTGKELVARAIYRNSQRCDKQFISSDMGAIPETLFESELFGHVKGAFTDAKENRAGRFEMASEGTLFLDEIGNLPPALQPKLLAALNNRSIIRIGSNKEISIDIRLICATNMPIYDMIAENKFRQDLLYRINTVEIKLPPLRERGDDIALLAGFFLKLYDRKYQKNVTGIKDSALKQLSKHSWPGNVRELEHAVERAVIMSDGGMLTAKDFLLSGQRGRRDGLSINNFNLDEVEKKVVAKALTRHGGNVSQAAQELGLTRASLYRRMQKYDL